MGGGSGTEDESISIVDEELPPSPAGGSNGKNSEWWGDLDRELCPATSFDIIFRTYYVVIHASSSFIVVD